MIHGIIPTHRIQIHPTLFPYRIPGNPPHEIGRVETIAVVVEAGFGIIVFCGIAERKDIGHWSAAGNKLAERVVCVLRDYIALCVIVAHDVAVGVVEWNVKLASGGVGSGGAGRRGGRDLLHAPVEVVIAAGAQPPFAYCLLCLHVVLRKHKL